MKKQNFLKVTIDGKVKLHQIRSYRQLLNLKKEYAVMDACIVFEVVSL